MKTSRNREKVSMETLAALMTLIVEPVIIFLTEEHWVRELYR